MDTNVNNYTLQELLDILNIDDPTEENITSTTNSFIQQFTADGNPTMATFFTEVQSNLLQYQNGLQPNNPPPAEYPPQQSQTRNWWENEALRQSDPIQTEKNTDRKQKIDVYHNPYVPMKRQHLGVNNSYNLPVAQDVLNPNLKNIISRIINIDSQFRQSSNDSSTDFTLDLSEPLVNVLSLYLYSIQIPFSWYCVDVGSNCFWLSFYSPTSYLSIPPIPSYNVNVLVQPGNYSPSNFVIALNASLSATGLTFPTSTTTPVSYNVANGLITLNLYGGSIRVNGTTYTIDTTTLITFFDPTATLNCSANTCNPTLAINQSLGWIMGYRVPSVLVSATGNTAIAVLNLYGTKYVILVVDDYNQNHINSGLVGITEYSGNIKLPSYYSPDIPYVCVPPNPSGTNIALNSLALATNPNAGTLLMDKSNMSFKSTATVIPSAPRILTQSQIYSINEIMKNNDKTTNYKISSPSTPDILAIIPFKSGGMNTGDIFYEISGSLQDNRRVFFGPVNISRMRIRLIDDRGNVINLHGLDWSVSLVAEVLYQY